MTPDPHTAASEWMARRDAGLTAGEGRQLRAWLAEDPRNAAAFAAVDRAKTELDWPLHAGATDEILSGLADRAQRRRWRKRVVMRAGAAAAAIVLLLAVWRGGLEQGAGADDPSLIVRAPFRQTLPDGTVVDLKEGARIKTSFTALERRVTLTAGTAHFKVTKESRPFVVDASGVTAQALGTAFSVEMERGVVSVLVTEGRVAVNRDTTVSLTNASGSGPAAPLAVLGAGRAVSVSITSHAPTAAPEVAELPAGEVENRLAWRIPRLEFSGTLLKEVVTRVNQHNALQFVIADPALERLALSGVLRADKVEALVAMLESDFGVQAERRDSVIVLRRAR